MPPPRGGRSKRGDWRAVRPRPGQVSSLVRRPEKQSIYRSAAADVAAVYEGRQEDSWFRWREVLPLHPQLFAAPPDLQRFVNTLFVARRIAASRRGRRGYVASSRATGDRGSSGDHRDAGYRKARMAITARSSLAHQTNSLQRRWSGP